MATIPAALDHASVQTLLNISGRDVLNLGQKYKKGWEGVLASKLIFTSNNPLNITDPVLLTRLIVVDFQQSWLDRPDKDDHLRDKLDLELSGIANRCLGAYRRLVDRGQFIQPESAASLSRTIAAKTNPIVAFMQDRWVIDDKASGPTAEAIYSSFVAWCERQRRADLLSSNPKNELIKNIKQIGAYSWLHTVKPHGEQRCYPGLRPRTKKDEENDE